MSSQEIDQLRQEVARLSSALQKVTDRNEISDLITRYGQLHDKLMVGPSPTSSQKEQFELDVQEWENLFTEDVEAVFTLSRTRGNKGFGDVFRCALRCLFSFFAFKNQDWQAHSKLF